MPTLQENVDKVLESINETEDNYLEVANIIKRSRQENGKRAFTLDEIDELVEQVQQMPVDNAPA